MKNEMTGIEVSDEIIARYKECVTKEDGESVGVEIAKEAYRQGANVTLICGITKSSMKL